MHNLFFFVVFVFFFHFHMCIYNLYKLQLSHVSAATRSRIRIRICIRGSESGIRNPCSGAGETHTLPQAEASEDLQPLA